MNFVGKTESSALFDALPMLSTQFCIKHVYCLCTMCVLCGDREPVCIKKKNQPVQN